MAAVVRAELTGHGFGDATECVHGCAAIALEAAIASVPPLPPLRDVLAGAPAASCIRRVDGRPVYAVADGGVAAPAPTAPQLRYTVVWTGPRSGRECARCSVGDVQLDHPCSHFSVVHGQLPARGAAPAGAPRARAVGPAVAAT